MATRKEMAKITKREMADILSNCRICGMYRKPVDWICKNYKWQELKDLYDEMPEALEEYYSNRYN